MKRPIATALAFAFVVGIVLGSLGLARRSAVGDSDRGLAHMVFFELTENTDASAQKLIAGCKEYLTGHDGTIYYSVGVLADDLKRDVNDRDFQVALHLVFKGKDAHDRYQSSERHQKFIEECKGLWKKVRVFDSYVVSGPILGGAKKSESAEADAPAWIPLPDRAAGFAGLIRGQVVGRRGEELVLYVDAVQKSWKHSKAPDAKAMVGEKVLVRPPDREGDEPKRVARFLKMLEVGETVTLDVAHKGGETLTVLELTKDQRIRLKR